MGHFNLGGGGGEGKGREREEGERESKERREGKGRQREEEGRGKRAGRRVKRGGSDREGDEVEMNVKLVQQSQHAIQYC